MSEKTVDAYVAEAPDSMRADIEEIRAMMRAALPHAVECMSPNDFAIYTNADGDWMCGFAHRKKGPMFYMMQTDLLDQHEDRLGRLRSGRSCVAWKPSKTLSMDDLREIGQDMLVEVAKRIPRD